MTQEITNEAQKEAFVASISCQALCNEALYLLCSKNLASQMLNLSFGGEFEKEPPQYQSHQLSDSVYHKLIQISATALIELCSSFIKKKDYKTQIVAESLWGKLLNKDSSFLVLPIFFEGSSGKDLYLKIFFPLCHYHFKLEQLKKLNEHDLVTNKLDSKLLENMQLQVQYILREKKILVRDFCKLSVGDLIVFPENKKKPISIYIEKKTKV